MLLTPEVWSSHRSRMPPGLFRTHLGREGRLQDEVRPLAALVCGLMSEDFDVELVDIGPGSQWIGDPDLHPIADLRSSGRLSLMTSGTSGPPKTLTLTLSERRRPCKSDPDARWLWSYVPGRWASISVLMHVMETEGSMAVASDLSPQALVDCALAQEVTHLALTPSLFRLVLAAGGSRLRDTPVRQVTFGGETTSQSVLDMARDMWPGARITHVLATTEAGDICSASDGLAGYPWERVSRAGGHLASDGELHISGSPTGDLWEMKRGRIFHVGRRYEVINVGGIKISPHTVEDAALQLPGVLEVAAYPVPNALLGQVVGLDVIGTVDVHEVRHHLITRLDKHARPSLIRIVDRIERSAGGKIKRNVK